MACASLPEAGARAGARGRPPGIGGLRSGCPTPRGPRPARLSGPGAPRRNPAAASLGTAEPAPVGASPKRGPPAVAPECRARQPRLPTWKVRGGKKAKGVRLGCWKKEKASFPLAKQLNLGVGRSRQLKKKASTQFIFFSISLVTGSPRIPYTRRLRGGGRVDFTPHEMSGEIRRLSQNLTTKYAKPQMKNTTSSNL